MLKTPPKKHGKLSESEIPKRALHHMQLLSRKFPTNPFLLEMGKLKKTFSLPFAATGFKPPLEFTPLQFN
jgi:hypothetical protein